MGSNVFLWTSTWSWPSIHIRPPEPDTPPPPRGRHKWMTPKYMEWRVLLSASGLITCNAVYISFSSIKASKLQAILYAAARFIGESQGSPIGPISSFIYWLPIRQRICSLMRNCLYIILEPCVGLADFLWSARRRRQFVGASPMPCCCF